ncbi:hypothetical protein BDDG_04738 [Blastomyces dermatitidis ATCC 18188]|uniref:Uncharacterized protein n=1 Tax=Ajellomyces dermatitidis (strain ATCC 18188 / CBS 674.68) TaxID=653446 RepID=F2TEL8_AJEDA|nr:hypothetical protein BDDG_04738 [Blastomyces dermatitidis ATCC 18188]
MIENLKSSADSIYDAIPSRHQRAIAIKGKVIVREREAAGSYRKMLRPGHQLAKFREHGKTCHCRSNKQNPNQPVSQVRSGGALQPDARMSQSELELHRSMMLREEKSLFASAGGSRPTDAIMAALLLSAHSPPRGTPRVVRMLCPKKVKFHAGRLVRRSASGSLSQFVFCLVSTFRR